ncbi:MAG: hypothetical protein O7G86_11845 [Gammaproteobacteria bacterium]|nr:hypothetical protein [Gammaproteobacteria bacterium]
MAYIDPQDSDPEGRDKTLILVHGRGCKPAEDELLTLWREALNAGVYRDGGDEQLVRLQQVNTLSAYYGDLSNDILSETQQSFDVTLDVADRRNTLLELKALTKTKQFRRISYEDLPGRSSIREFFADIGAPLLSTLRLTDLFLARVMPEVVAYWDKESDYHRKVSQRMIDVLLPPLARGDDIMMIVHCLGSVIAYDALWEISRGGMVAENAATSKVEALVTLGSPLGDEFVKSRLAGSTAEGDEKFPNNLISWSNVAAEDDYTCHDETVANDFRGMLNGRLISRITDYRIYNLAVRYGRSNPHNALGYLIHPRVAKLVSEWL